MADERTYGFNRDDAQSLIQSISSGESIFPEIRPRGGRGGGGEIIKFTIDTVDCTDPDNPLWNVAWTHYTKACTEPPGVDEYTGFIEVIPPCNVPFTDAELEAGGSGLAIQLYPKEAEGVDCSVAAWYAFDICANNGCSE